MMDLSGAVATGFAAGFGVAAGGEFVIGGDESGGTGEAVVSTVLGSCPVAVGSTQKDPNPPDVVSPTSVFGKVSTGVIESPEVSIGPVSVIGGVPTIFPEVVGDDVSVAVDVLPPLDLKCRYRK
jgi:hypothetical protein